MKELKCPFCGTKMKPHHALVSHALWDTDNYVGIYARDEVWKCTSCYYVAMFGVPITKEEYERTVKLWGRPTNTRYLMDKEKMKKRLTALGYLDVDK